MLKMTLMMKKMRNFKITFILGGACSGKSDFALEKANQTTGSRAFIATAQALDPEMEQRIEKHKKQRGQDWDTYEEPLDLSETMLQIADKYNVIVIDCLTLWISNLMANEHRLNIEKRFIKFKNAMVNLKQNNRQDTSWIYIVSNEVGMAVVPENPLARRFRDLAGTLNKIVAEAADEVYIVYAGLPLLLKGQNNV